MTTPAVTPSPVRAALLLREEIALLDVRHEAAFATGHPLFAANMAADRIALEAETRLPRKDVSIVVYDACEGFVPLATDRLRALGCARREPPTLIGELTASHVPPLRGFIDRAARAKDHLTH